MTLPKQKIERLSLSHTKQGTRKQCFRKTPAATQQQCQKKMTRVNKKN